MFTVLRLSWQLSFIGRQHFYYTQRFFESKYDFEQAVERDKKKLEKCQELGIALIVFRYNDLLTEEAVYDRMLQAIRSAEPIKNKSTKKSVKNNKYYQEQKKKYNKRKKDLYRKMKNRKKYHDR